MSEINFLVEEAHEGGYTARAVGDPLKFAPKFCLGLNAGSETPSAPRLHRGLT